MPTYYRDDSKPVVQFEPLVEVTPFILFRRLKEGDRPLLIDARAEPAGLTLEGAEPWPGEGWEPPADRDVLVFDGDGSEAVALARRLLEAGFTRVRALFGGLELYEFALDPEVVGEETFLVRLESAQP